jgi:hypothetical protein
MRGDAVRASAGDGATLRPCGCVNRLAHEGACERADALRILDFTQWLTSLAA